MLAITKNRDFHGIVGMESNVVINGAKICVGDTVQVGSSPINNGCTSVVIVLGNSISVMGLGAMSLSELKIISIVQSHKVLKTGDLLHNGYLKVEEFIQ